MSAKIYNKYAKICRNPYFACFSYICTPHFADSDVSPWLSPWQVGQDTSDLESSGLLKLWSTYGQKISGASLADGSES